MATLEDIRTALAAALDAAIDDVQISPYMLTNPTPPAIHIYPTEIDYDLASQVALGAFAMWKFTVQALVGLTTDQGAQKVLDAMLAPSGDRSVKAAVEADRSLGGAVQDCRVETATGYRIYSFETAVGALRGPLLGCEWTVAVIA
jgi:hypothetical protein